MFIAIIAGEEVWDDSNDINGDGWNSSCKIESGYYCPTPGSPWIKQWSNGIVILIKFIRGDWW